MDVFVYRVQYGNGSHELFSIRARSINAGYARAVRMALAHARMFSGDRRDREIEAIRFWERRSA